MNGRTIRTVERALHITVGVLLLVLVFTPLGEGTFGAALRYVLAPLLGLTGVLMWQHARVTKLLRGRTPEAPARHRA